MAHHSRRAAVRAPGALAFPRGHHGRAPALRRARAGRRALQGAQVARVRLPRRCRRGPPHPQTQAQRQPHRLSRVAAARGPGAAGRGQRRHGRVQQQTPAHAGRADCVGPCRDDRHQRLRQRRAVRQEGRRPGRRAVRAHILRRERPARPALDVVVPAEQAALVVRHRRRRRRGRAPTTRRPHPSPTSRPTRTPSSSSTMARARAIRA
jgi:hypothetical protein